MFEDELNEILNLTDEEIEISSSNDDDILILDNGEYCD